METTDWRHAALRLLSKGSPPEVAEINALLLDATMDVVSAEGAFVLFLDDIKQRLLFRPAAAKQSEIFNEIDLGSGNMGGDGIAGKVAVSGSSMKSAENESLWGMVASEPCFQHNTSPVRNCLAVPCKTLDGKVAGVLLATNSANPDGFGFGSRSPSFLVLMTCTDQSAIFSGSNHSSLGTGCCAL